MKIEKVLTIYFKALTQTQKLLSLFFILNFALISVGLALLANIFEVPNVLHSAFSGSLYFILTVLILFF